MRGTLIMAAGLIVGLATAGLGPSSAWAGQEKADKAFKAQLMECKKIADPGQKDECVRNARSTYEKREPAESRTMFGTEKAKDGTTKKAAPKGEDAAIGMEEVKKKAGKAKNK